MKYSIKQRDKSGFNNIVRGIRYAALDLLYPDKFKYLSPIVDNIDKEVEERKSDLVIATLAQTSNGVNVDDYPAECAEPRYGCGVSDSITLTNKFVGFTSGTWESFIDGSVLTGDFSITWKFVNDNLARVGVNINPTPVKDTNFRANSDLSIAAGNGVIGDIYESNVPILAVGNPFNLDDIYGIYRVGTAIKYTLNGVDYHTSAIADGSDVTIQGIFRDGGGVTDVRVEGAVDTLVNPEEGTLIQ